MDTLSFVTTPYKHAVATIRQAYDLEQKTRKGRKSELLALIRRRVDATCARRVRDPAEALGLGHAGSARSVVGDEPLPVLLPRDLIWNKGGVR